MLSYLDAAVPVPPGQILKKKFLEPNKCSTTQFALLAGFRLKNIKTILRDGFWSHSAIRKVSVATNTAPRYWYYIQSAWLFHKYCSSRKGAPNIEPISLKIQTRKEPKAPGYILETKFLKPTGRNYNSLEKLIGVSDFTLQKIVSGKQAITPLMAYRLAKSFGTCTQYWRDLESAYEIHCLLNSNENIDRTIRDSLVEYRDRVYSLEDNTFNEIRQQPAHLGRFLLHKFFKPSGIALKDWRHLFCVSTKLFKNIFAGKTEIPLHLMIRICRVFKIEIGSLIEMQKQFYALKAEHDCRRLQRKPQRVLPMPDGIGHHQHPFQIMNEGFLKPMHISIVSFMRYIGMDGKKFEHLRRERKKIDFELAIRIGQALETGPLYWINMQLEFDIRGYEKMKQEELLRLN